MGLFSKKQTIPATGFYALPQEYQSLYRGLLGDAGNIIRPDGQLNTDMFTPLPTTADEERAFSILRQGLTPTQDSISRDVAMLQNPFDEYVINDINREAQGQNSILNQALSKTGQMGSNRSILGASDVEQQRLNNVGRFRQENYNNAVNASLGTLSNLRQQDAQNLLGIGTFERGLDEATRQAPLSALSAGQNALSGFQTEFGNFGSPQRTVKTGTGLGSLLGSVAPIVGSAFGPLGTIAGSALGGFASSGGTLSGAIGGGFKGLAGGGLSGLGITGGLDPSTGINWNSGRYGGGFFG
jgi:hypothetical protein